MASPGWLALQLALAPRAVRCFVALPGTALVVLLCHFHAMLQAPALRRGLCGRRRLNWEPRQQGGQTLQEPAFITIPQGDLHLAASEGDVTVDRGRRLR